MEEFMKEKAKTLEELERTCKLAYYKEWRATHKENVKRHNQNFWRKKALIAAQQNKEEENGQK